ncbi:hypothetical protein [Mesorhizobium sp. INR15]|uniref:hypothetical protein n=1 Tax=Mesorhizobium sp. INR15 TaxID=2654248 RepID=UPI0018966E27|nr:hypothetical protein [Mesorhizobium sp. INR15]QPC93369.1 hypothetical protein GA829_23910 [Mesorhizobium sp. INR15]
MRRFMVTMAMCAFAAGPALATEPYVGTWSKDRANCTASADVQSQTVYSVQQNALSVPELGCEHATFRKTATGWVVHASQCYGSDPTLEEPFSRVIHIVKTGTSLRFTWPGFDSGPLARC